MDDNLIEFTKNLNVSKKSIDKNEQLKAASEQTPEGMSD